ncbi:hypothetical protein ACKI1I_14860 [Streptomyces turgidiscabies]|uniref:Secreted protein n=1 Tax=Streptomyces turgidiscabies (strain Car8) TaxID=698760 RepID=L7F8I5_STRT8|nr:MULTISPECIES: hypothetical protein [Streptomyces]ELP66985.1 hypothetical protein STRTUCAR8_06317 [Streptomyces turgidiscabies Car8]MDX3493159.1 hypothetical protein [Streptomyces turgidiscabies]GAQ70456.1 hypothetical protein T45_02191 [Streptomyces turgidiscabies]
MRKVIAASISAGVIALATLGTAGPAAASATVCGNGGDGNLGYWQVCYTVNGDGLYVDSVQGTARRTDGGGAKSIHLEYVKAGDVHWRNSRQVSSNNYTDTQSVKGNVSKSGDYCAKLWVAYNGGHYWAGQACVNIHP